MENNTKSNIILGIIAFAMIVLVLINDAGYENSILPQPSDAPSLPKLSFEKPFLVDDTNAGPMDFDSAESYCKQKGMTLPTREQAWEMWRASANCKMAMVTGKHIIKDKETFLKSCHEENTHCTTVADKVNYTCNPNEDLLFLDEKSYRLGNYWLKDKYDRNGHYSANFITGVTNAYRDDIKLLGVRCVREVKNK